MHPPNLILEGEIDRKDYVNDETILNPEYSVGLASGQIVA
jgi:hypothetical protein